MTANTISAIKPHTLKHFDTELNQLHQLSLGLTGLLVEQWTLLLEALGEANLESALEVIAMHNDIHDAGHDIQQAVLTILAKEHPVAGDLRVILSISKISATVAYFSEEITKIGRLTVSLYEPRNGIPNARLLKDIMKLGNDIQGGLANLESALRDYDAEHAHKVLSGRIEFENAIHGAIQQQFIFINQDLRQVGPGMTIMQILNSLESCQDHCKNLAEYCILMIDGQDVRHTVTYAPALHP